MSEAKVVVIFGFGSLMDVQSAHNTMPSASNFRRGILRHHSRVYSLVSIGGLKSGRANLATREVAALAARPSQGSSIRGVLFDIPEEEFAAYAEREHRYLLEKRPVLQLGDGTGELEIITSAFTCLEQTDEQYLASLPGGAKEWEDRVGQHYPSAGPAPRGGEGGRLWGRADVLPMPAYMANVIAAASTLGEEWLLDAVDSTFLVDGTTSLRAYIRERLDGSDSEELRQVLGDRSLRLLAGSDSGSVLNMTLLQYFTTEATWRYA